MTKVERKKRLRNFVAQRCNARIRGIAFLLTFDEWLQIWIESGHLKDRGKGKYKYCMARNGDSGPYAVGNVKIVTGEENLRERQYSAEVRAKMSAALLGNKRTLGFRHSAKSIAHMRAIKTGKKHSAATIAKMRASALRRWSESRA